MTTFVGWAFLEQLALAAIDVGRIDVADVCAAPCCTFDDADLELTNEALAVSAATL